MNAIQYLSPFILSISVVQTSYALCSNTERFHIDIANNTVLDESTGLMWQRCAIGNYGEHCEQGDHSPLNLEEAKTTAESAVTANHDDWRIPTVKELNSLVDIRCYNPSTDSSAFPNTPAHHFWTSDTFVDNTAKQWTINFYFGEDGVAPRNQRLNLRLVRETETSDS